jgi:hypothetical protein
MSVPLLRPINSRWLSRYWLTILLAIAYMFSTWLTIEQNRVILAQRSLIQSLYYDSASLTALKIKLAQQSKK